MANALRVGDHLLERLGARRAARPEGTATPGGGGMKIADERSPSAIGKGLRRRLGRHRGDDGLEHARGEAARPRAEPAPARATAKVLGIEAFEDDVAQAASTTSRTGATAPAGASCAGCSAPRACPPAGRDRGPRRRRLGQRAGDAAGARRRAAVDLLGQARRSRSTSSTTPSTRPRPASPTNSSRAPAPHSSGAREGRVLLVGRVFPWPSPSGW